MEQQLSQPQKLLNRDFFLLWQGQTISQFGTQGFEIAMIFWVKHATDSATIMGLLLMISSIPAIFLGPIAGTFADRYSRRKIIISTDVIRGIAVLALAFIMIILASAPVVHAESSFRLINYVEQVANPGNVPLIIGMLLIVSLILSISSSFFAPAISASVPDLVPKERLTSANALAQFSFQLAMFFGQGIGGTLFRILGAPALFLIDGLTYLFSAFSESFITIPQEIPEKDEDWRDSLQQFKSDTIDGLSYIWQKSGLRDLVLVSALLNFFMAPILLLMPFYVEDHLQATPDWYGFLLATYGFGSMLGFVFAGGVNYSGRIRGLLMVLFIIGEPLGFIALALVEISWAALVVILVGGFFSGFVLVNITTILQMSTPDDIRGRVFGLLGTIAAALTPLAMGLSGIIADLSGQDIPLIYAACGILAGILAIAITARKNFRRFISSEFSE